MSGSLLSSRDVRTSFWNLNDPSKISVHTEIRRGSVRILTRAPASLLRSKPKCISDPFLSASPRPLLSLSSPRSLSPSHTHTHTRADARTHGAPEESGGAIGWLPSCASLDTLAAASCCTDCCANKVSSFLTLKGETPTASLGCFLKVKVTKTYLEQTHILRFPVKPSLWAENRGGLMQMRCGVHKCSWQSFKKQNGVVQLLKGDC